MVYTSDYPIFYVAVDIVAFTLTDDVLQVLVIQRGGDPAGGEVALPGGFVGPEEDLTTAAARELTEETGVAAARLEQLASYGDPDRDPRGRVVSVAHLAVLTEAVEPMSGTDAAAASWRPVTGVGAMAFDHEQILADAVARLRTKLEWTSMAADFLPAEFTLAELRAVYEAVWGRSLDPGNFQRKIRNSPSLFAPSGARRAAGRGRPAALFRAVMRE